MGVAARADLAAHDLVFRQPCGAQLVPGKGPEIEMVAPDPVAPEFFRNLPPIIDKLRTAGPQRGADAGHDGLGVAAEALLHERHGPTENIGDAAPPAAVHIGHHPTSGVVEHDALAVGHLDQQQPTGNVGDRAVGRWRGSPRRPVLGVLAGDTPEGRPMGLTQPHQLPAAERVHQQAAVGGDRRRLVAAVKAHVKPPEGTPAAAAQAGEDRMPDLRPLGKAGKLKKPQPLPGYE